MNFYLNKYGFQPPVIAEFPAEDLGIIVVIPCFNEGDLIQTLSSLKACDLPGCSVEIITVINAGSHHPREVIAQNRATYEAALSWRKQNDSTRLTFHFIQEGNLPKKHAGVGLARKIGMDEAVYRFDLIGKDGIIVCFDADSCCEPNYLQAIEAHFQQHPKTPGCSIHFEHPISGTTFEMDVYEGIINYELHLRYYNQALKYAGLPYAFHTVGSSMAVRSSAYQKQGGMNKRKAGEDFYFIHKIIALGNFTELKSTTVIPSPRVSDRVPFGTGKAIAEWVDHQPENYLTYSFESFQVLKTFLKVVPDLYEQNFQPETIDLQADSKQLLLDFLAENNFTAALNEIRSNAKTIESFTKRFFGWLDAFKVLKMVHFMRDNGLGQQPLFEALNELSNALNHSVSFSTVKEQLLFYRNLEQK